MKCKRAWVSLGVLIAVIAIGIVAALVWRDRTSVALVNEFRHKYGLVVGDFYGVVINQPDPPDKIPAETIEEGLRFLVKNRLPSFFLSVPEAELTGVSIDLLSQMSWLNALELAETNVCDDDLPKIAQLTALSSLGLAGTNVTDAGLRHLRGLKHLRTLYVGGSKVTANGLRDLAAELPDLDVSAQLRLLEE